MTAPDGERHIIDSTSSAGTVECRPQSHFQSVQEKVGRFDVTGKTLLIPNMAPYAARLMAASFRAFDVPAVVMETYNGLPLGKEFTSGKECFPCQVTLGDLLHHLKKEKERLGSAFKAGNYIYFLPEAEGPCRFGMYSKFQRLVLDGFPDFQDIPISCLTSEDSYSPEGILPGKQATVFKKLAYVSCVIADTLDRIVWRVRPYEKFPGMTDNLMKEVLNAMAEAVEKNGAKLEFKLFHEILEDTALTMKSLMDDRQPRRPRIAVIGEIYLRSHPQSNQDIIRLMELCGGEVVNASIVEWLNYVMYSQARQLRKKVKKYLRCLKLGSFVYSLKPWLAQEIEYLYATWRQRQVYGRVLKHLDIEPDHEIGVIEKRLDRDRIFSFDVGTETVLSIGGALESVHEGFNGVVNVFPFTCMPGAACSAILGPLLKSMKVPYLDAPYDGTIQPNREAALRTFIYQAGQHLERGGNGRTGHK